MIAIITVGDRSYRTLGDAILVNGKKVYEAYADGCKVYPETGEQKRTGWDYPYWLRVSGALSLRIINHAEFNHGHYRYVPGGPHALNMRTSVVFNSALPMGIIRDMSVYMNIPDEVQSRGNNSVNATPAIAHIDDRYGVVYMKAIGIVLRSDVYNAELAYKSSSNTPMSTYVSEIYVNTAQDKESLQNTHIYPSELVSPIVDVRMERTYGTYESRFVKKSGGVGRLARFTSAGTHGYDGRLPPSYSEIFGGAEAMIGRSSNQTSFVIEGLTRFIRRWEVADTDFNDVYRLRMGTCPFTSIDYANYDVDAASREIMAGGTGGKIPYAIAPESERYTRL